jgi:PAS domain S-box-containing protein
MRRKMKIGKKLSGAFIIMIALVVIVGAIGFYSLHETKYWWESAETGGLKILRMADDIQIGILNAHIDEENFLLEYHKKGLLASKEEYITNKFTKHTKNVRSLVDKIEVIEVKHGHAEDIEKVKTFREELNKYTSGVNKVVDLIVARGLQDEGLIGEYRKAINVLENSINEKLKEKTNVQADNSNYDKILISLLYCRRIEKDFLLREESQYISSFKGRITVLEKLLKKSNLSSADQDKLIGLVEDYKTKFLKVADITLEIRQVVDEYHKSITKIEQLAEEMHQEGLKMANDDIKIASVIGDNLTQVLIYSIILTIIIGIAISIFVTNMIKNPIVKLANMTREVAKNNDFTVPIEIKQKDEIGDLAKSFKDMLENLKKSFFENEQKIKNLDSLPAVVVAIDKDFTISYMNPAGARVVGTTPEKAVGQKCYDLLKTKQCNTNKCACAQAMRGNGVFTEETVARPGDKDIDIKYTGAPMKDAQGNVTGALEFVLDISDEKTLQKTIIEGAEKLAASIAEITSTIVQLAANTSESSSAIEEITTTVTEVRQVSETAHERAVEVSEKAESVNVTAEAGKQATVDTVEGIEKIKKEMASIAESTIKLGEQTQNIGEIISSVNGLADQSNLLSVNASIEAAKAGEFGKGFAVVAREVKALAEQSKLATKQINSILTDIQKATSSAVMATERGTNAVANGQELSNAAGNAISRLAENMRDSAESSLQIAASSQEQLAGMDQLRSALESIKSAVTQNMSGTKQLEQAGMQMSELANELKSTIDNLK